MVLGHGLAGTGEASVLCIVLAVATQGCTIGPLVVLLYMSSLG